MSEAMSEAEFQAELERLKAQNQALEARVSALETRLNIQEPLSSKMPGLAGAKHAVSDKDNPDILAPHRQQLNQRLKNFKPEQTIGLTAFAWLGILALITGLGFLIRHAFVSQWITHLTIIILGLCLGVGLVVGGQWIARNPRYTFWARTLVGGGLALTYFTIYAAYHFETYRQATGISQGLDIALLILVVLVAVAMAWLDQSRSVASRAFFLGYLTVIFSQDFEFLTLVYGVLLTLGLVWVTLHRNWPEIALGGVVAAYAAQTYWVYRNPDALWLGGGVLLLYFALFCGFVYWRDEGEDTLVLNRAFGVALLNSLLFFIPAFRLDTQAVAPVFAGGFYLVYALLFHGFSLGFYPHKNELTQKHIRFLLIENSLFLGFLLWRFGHAYALSLPVIFWITMGLNLGLFFGLQRFKAFLSSLLPQTYLQLSLVWACFGILLSVDPPWLSLLWASQTLLICALLPNLPQLKSLGEGLGLVVALELCLYELPEQSGAPLYLIVTLALLLAGSWLAQRPTYRSLKLPILIWAPSLTALVAIAQEFNTVWISIGWALLALGLLLPGFAFGMKAFRLQGLMILLLTVVKVFLVDTTELPMVYRTLSFIILGLILLGVSFLYTRYQEKINQWLEMDEKVEPKSFDPTTENGVD